MGTVFSLLALGVPCAFEHFHDKHWVAIRMSVEIIFVCTLACHCRCALPLVQPQHSVLSARTVTF